jgi:phytoene synthase
MAIMSDLLSEFNFPKNKNKVSLDESYEFCKKVAGEYAKTFYFATKFFPLEKQRATFALYGFCRYTDNLVDNDFESSSGDLAKKLKDWKTKTKKALRDGDSDHPILKAFVHTAKKYKIEESLALDIIRGVEMDLTKRRYESFEELEEYCYLVASVVGLIMVKIIGFNSDKAFKYAVDLGKAMQITNILRDIHEDSLRGRIYLPKEDLEKFNYSEKDIQNKIVNKNFKLLISFYTEIAKKYYSRSMKGLGLLNPDGIFAVKSASVIYGKILDKIEEIDYDIYSKRASTSNFEKVCLALGVLISLKFSRKKSLQGI